MKWDFGGKIKTIIWNNNLLKWHYIEALIQFFCNLFVKLTCQRKESYQYYLSNFATIAILSFSFLSEQFEKKISRNFLSVISFVSLLHKTVWEREKVRWKKQRSSSLLQSSFSSSSIYPYETGGNLSMPWRFLIRLHPVKKRKKSSLWNILCGFENNLPEECT